MSLRGWRRQIYYLRKNYTSSSECHIFVKSESIFKKYQRFKKLLKRSFRCNFARLSTSIGLKVIKKNRIKSLSKKTKQILIEPPADLQTPRLVLISTIAFRK